MGRLKRLLLPAALLVAAYYALFGGEHSWLDVRRARAETEAEARALARLGSEIDSMAAWADSLETDPATLERLARERFGLIRDGEVLYRFAPADSAAAGDSIP